MKTIIEMAREAGIRDCVCNGTMGCLKRFAELVRADEREALAQPEQGASLKMQDIVCPNCGDMARTWPKQERPWVSLTREEINSALSKYASWYDFAAHLENILKEKNQ